MELITIFKWILIGQKNLPYSEKNLSISKSRVVTLPGNLEKHEKPWNLQFRPKKPGLKKNFRETWNFEQKSLKNLDFLTVFTC